MDSVETNSNSRLDPGIQSGQFSFDNNENGLMLTIPSPSPSLSATGKDTKLCSKCQDPIKDGKFYEMDGHQWHEHCFSCSRCHKTMSNNKNFITLSNAKDSCILICNDCSKNCQHCNKPINDMAIILSSNEAYCQECFKCYKCNEQIKDLKYVKTKKGLYCINCHKRLLIKRQILKERHLKQQQQQQQLLSSSPVKTDTLETSEPFALPKRSNMRPRQTDTLHTQNLHRHSRSLSNTKHINMDETNTPNNNNVTPTESHSRINSDERDVSKSNHSRSMSLDDVLNATLQDDGFSTDDDDSIDNKIGTVEGNDQLPSPIHETNLEHLITPINSMSSGSISTSRTNNNISLNSSNSDNDRNSSTKSRKSLFDVTESSNNNTLLKTPELRQNPSNKKINLPLNSPMATSNSDNIMSSPNKNKILSTTTALNNNNNNNRNNQYMNSIDMIQASNTINKGLALEFNDTNQKISNMVKSNSHNQIGPMTRHEFPPENVPVSHTENGNKKLGRSLSLKSKNFFSHWKSKGHHHNSSDSNNKKFDPQNLPPRPTSKHDQDFDTHSGWGVSPPNGLNSSPNPSIAPSTTTTTTNNNSISSASFSHHSSRGKSDTLIYHNSKTGMINDQDLSTPTNKHQRNKSSTLTDPKSASGVAMFRTPPLNNQTSFRRLPNTASTGVSHSTNSSISKPTINVSESVDGNAKSEMDGVDPNNTINQISPRLHGRSASWQSPLFNNNGSKVKMPITEENSDRDEMNHHVVSENDDDEEEGEEENIDSIELKLRKLKLEVKEMEVTKQKLNIEIDSLKCHKEDLVNDINKLRDTKQKYYDTSSSPSNSLSEDFSNDTAMKSTNTLGVDGNKPKFWKLFSNTNSSSHHHVANNNVVGTPPLNSGNTVSQRSLVSNSTNPLNTVGNGSVASLMTSADSTNSRNNANTATYVGSISGASSHNLTLSQYCFKDGDTTPHVPDIIIQCIDFIELNKNNLETEGIYRKSGSQTLIEEVEKRLYLDHGDINLSDDNIHVVTNVLKRFLRRLPDPIISFEIYDPLIDLVKDNNLIMNLPLTDNSDEMLDSNLFEFIKVSMTKLLEQLPRENLEVLKLLFKHINLVSQYSKFNLMNLHNLALVFTPSLIHDITGERDMIDMKERNYIVEFALLHGLV